MLLNKKGFFLAELMIVGSILSLAIVILYTQTSTVINNYNERIKYNTVDGIYALNNIKILIKQGDAASLIQKLNTSKYVDITGSNCSYSSNLAYCNSIIGSLKAKKILLTKYNVTDLKTFSYTNDFDLALKSFINKITIVDSPDYRLIIYLEDGSISTIKFKV